MNRSILFLHGLCGLGGGERYLINVINHLPEHYKIHLIVPESECTFAMKIQKQIVLHSHPFKRSFGPFPSLSLALYFQLKKIIATHNIDVIHTGDHYLLHIAAFAAKTSGKKLIFTAHGAWDTHFLINRIILNMSDPLTLTATPTHYARLVPLVEKLFYQPFFTDCKAPEGKRCMGSPVRIGIVGRFSHVKNHLLAFDVLEKLKNENVELHIFGDTVHQLSEESDSYRRSILSMAAAKKNVISHGFVDEISVIYSNIDILLVTSITESFGFTAIEAQSYGVPVVTTPTEGSSVTVCDGYSGFIVESAEKIASSIKTIINNYEEFSSNAFQNSQKFQAKEYIKLFTRVMNG